MARPVGVTILGILCLIGGVLAFGFAFLFLFGSSYLVQLTGMPNYIASIAAMAAAAGIAIGILDLLIAYGLFTLANWARILAIVCVALSLGGTVFRSARLAFRLGLFPLPSQIVMGVVDILILWYLSRARVKRAFLHEGGAPAAPATPGAPAS